MIVTVTLHEDASVKTAALHASAKLVAPLCPYLFLLPVRPHFPGHSRLAVRGYPRSLRCVQSKCTYSGDSLRILFNNSRIARGVWSPVTQLY